MVGLGRPLLPEILGQPVPIGAKSPIFNRWTSSSAVTPSEKSSINTNRKSTTRFPMSLRWSSYVAPKSPKGVSKTQNGRFSSKIGLRLKKVCYKVSFCETVSGNVIRHLLAYLSVRKWLATPSPLGAFEWAKDEHCALSQSPQTVARKRKVSKLWTISCDNSETVRDRMSVTINHYRKSHTGFRLVPTSMTLNDLERRNVPYFAFLTKLDRFWGRLYHSGWR